MKETSDWNVLPGFLHELRIAKCKVEKLQLVKMIRLANEMGTHGSILECINQADKTGLYLHDLNVVREVIWGGFMRAEKGGWSEKATQKGLNFVENIAYLLESKLHKRKNGLLRDDGRVQPDIIGVLLLMAAVRDIKHLGGRDEDGKVAQYVERLMANWHRTDFVGGASNHPIDDRSTNLSSQNGEVDNDDVDVATKEPTAGNMALARRKEILKEKETWWQANYELQRWAPVWKGMELASRLAGKLKPDLIDWLNRTVPDLHDRLERARVVVELSIDTEDPESIVHIDSTSTLSSTSQPESEGELQSGTETESTENDVEDEGHGESDTGKSLSGGQVVGKRRGLIWYAQLRRL